MKKINDEIINKKLIELRKIHTKKLVSFCKEKQTFIIKDEKNEKIKHDSTNIPG